MVTKRPTVKRRVEKITTLPVVHDGDAQEIYVDGISGLLPGYPNSKLSFYVTVDSTNGEEVRKNNLRLTMSTVTMLELFDTLSEVLVDNLKEVEEIAKQQQERLLAISTPKRTAKK
jgi:hypothetical protein